MDGAERDEFEFEDMEDSFDLWEALGEKRARVKKAYDREAHVAYCRAAAARRKAVNGVTTGLGISGGRGLHPTYEGAAKLWYMHPSLTAVPRLLAATALARSGPSRAEAVARAAGLRTNGACSLLQALAGTGIVRRAAPDRAVSAPNGRLYYRWELTETGRKYLWLAGLIHRKVIFLAGSPTPLRNDVNHNPLHALRRHAEPAFLRPAALALAFELFWMGPATEQAICTFAQMGIGTVNYHMRQWIRRGWVEQTGTWRKHSRAIITQRVWGFTAAGRLALARHVDALRRAARASGYRPEPVDWFFRYIPGLGEPDDPLEANSYTLFGKRYVNIPRGKV